MPRYRTTVRNFHREPENSRKGNVVNERIVAENAVCKIIVTAGDGKTRKEAADNLAVDVAVEGAYKKEEYDGADGAESRDELVFSQGRNENTDGDESRTDQENADNTADIHGSVGCAVKVEGNIINCRGCDEHTTEHGKCGKVFAHYDTEKSNGSGHHELIGAHFTLFTDELHGEKGDDNDEKIEQNGEIAGIACAFTGLNVIDHEKKCADCEKDRTEHISHRGREVSAHLTFVNGEHRCLL